MHVTQRPVVVALVLQFRERARGVRLMDGALQIGVQHADIEPSGNRIGVAGHQIFTHVGLLETLAVQGDSQFFEPDGVGFGTIEDVYVWRCRQLFRHVVLGIVVAVQNDGDDANRIEPRHLAVEKKAGVVFLPVGVVEIAGNDDERDLFLDGPVDQRRECGARRRAQQLDRCILVSGEPGQGAVDVNVGGVDELQSQDLSTVLGCIIISADYAS